MTRSKPLINGTGSEDYFLGSWDFGGRDGAQPFAHSMYGAPLIVNAERTGGRYCCYRWHGDNPVTFERYLKHTMEHGHANDRGDNFFSVGYWYQTTPYTDFPRCLRWRLGYLWSGRHNDHGRRGKRGRSFHSARTTQQSGDFFYIVKNHGYPPGIVVVGGGWGLVRFSAASRAHVARISRHRI